MILRTLFLTGVILSSTLLRSAAAGQDPAGPAPTLEDLAPFLRDMIKQALPSPLYEEKWNWGHTSPALHAVHWHGLRPEVIKTEKNQGTWRAIKVTPRDLKDKLVFKLSDLKHTGPDKMEFKAFLSFMAGVDFSQQIWEKGVRVYAGGTYARMRVNLAMVWESTLRLEPGQSFFPDTVLRLRVTRADLTYDQFAVEHIAGIGGTAAKLLGDAIHGTAKQIRPSLERDLLAKANAAIVKAGDTKEIRLGFGSLLGNKGK